MAYRQINARALRHSVTIQSRITTNTKGQQSVSYVWLEDVKAEFMPPQGREAIASGVVTATTSHVLKLRYRPAVRANMRVLYGSRVLEIERALHDEQWRRATILGCKEVNPA